MLRKPLLLFTLGLLSAGVCPLAAAATDVGGAPPLEWSRRMADSEMARLGDSLFHGQSKTARWTYDRTLFGLALLKLADTTDTQAYADFGAATAESFIRDDGSIADYDIEKYNIDLVAPGKVLLYRWENGIRPDKQRTALATLRQQMRDHPRTKDGGFWHKKRYPHQMWLDGLFMASPFLAQYGQVFDEPALFDEVVKQIVLMDRHAYDPESGLWFHGWDEARKQDWADKTTGLSPNFWGRAIGWYAMAVVDSLEFIPEDHPGVPAVRTILTKIADGIVRWQDPETGLWWQVTDQGGRKGNYLEATCSSMYVYALAKAIHHGWLPREKYLPAVLKGYEGIVRDLIREDADGRIHLTNCCEVAGLGFTNRDGRPRDGSFDYYVSEPVIDNDHKGLGPFIMAGIELTELLDDDHRVFLITDHGAKAGTLCTEAIQATIDACHAAGGGRVVVPAGEFRTGSIFLRQGVGLHLDKDAVLLGSTELKDYPKRPTRIEGHTEPWRLALLNGTGLKEVRITGEGTLDGNGEPFWKAFWQRRKENPKCTNLEVERPRLMHLADCRDVRIEGITLRRSGFWNLHLYRCQDVVVEGLSFFAPGRGAPVRAPSSDGIDIDSCQRVTVRSCRFQVDDDCIALKGSKGPLADRDKDSPPVEDIVVEDCAFLGGHGVLTLGSEATHVRHVVVRRCKVAAGINLVRLKLRPDTPQLYEDLVYEDIELDSRSGSIFAVNPWKQFFDLKGHEPPPSVVRNVTLRRIHGTYGSLGSLKGNPGDTITGLTMEDIDLELSSERFDVGEVGEVTVRDVTVNGSPWSFPKSRTQTR